MLKDEVIQTIKETAPLLRLKVIEVIKHFYHLLFTSNPELTPLFNSTNQMKGKQPLALAQAVYSYAAHIDNPQILSEKLKSIANKHFALGIKAEYYPIVGKNLLQALKDVLHITEEQIRAWSLAYGVLTDIFIKMEDELYKNSANKSGGWEDFRTFVLVEKKKESNVITSFYLKPKDGKAIADFIPGQYITLKMNLPNGNIIYRHYTLSNAPNGKLYRISVKREEAPTGLLSTPAGIASTYLHDHYEKDMEFALRPPAGCFQLRADYSKPVVLLSAGVGLTPMISMLNSLVVNNKNVLPVYYVHAAINSETHAFSEHVEELNKQYSNLHTSVSYSAPLKNDFESNKCNNVGFITKSLLTKILPHKDCNYYFCGPEAFMKNIRSILTNWDVAESQIHYESFGPQLNL
ncbi:NO-inducible flavohemoprotein [Rickettsia endosymbiont of Halotydeus destructor]|uniref:NO-inducible flavohemoprotein n=1 Tax=Rickettsia endosymbiont of Halotydeus destructor TaxID=2996754 RepID=UPI003BB08925